MLDQTSREERHSTFWLVFDKIQELFDSFGCPSGVVSKRAVVDAYLKVISLRGPGRPVREVWESARFLTWCCALTLRTVAGTVLYACDLLSVYYEVDECE